ncbi:hypothetical protein FJ364_06155, partial [Candidatus Dependentiae bacterium]|nr:hypothetical protein [Candidatus Dependentiae bacterium]
MIKQRCSLILSMIGLCTAVLVLLGLLVPEWGFLHDDYGMLWHVSHINSWQSLCKLFFEPGMHV